MANDEKSRTLSYGGRKADKLVRCYLKDDLGVFRVEVELHSGLLQRNDISTLNDFLYLPDIVYPRHFQFVALDWRRLEQYLRRRLGDDNSQIIARARRRAASLQEVFGGDEALISFISRAVGYSLTGDTREQCLFILWGGGANGKTTFLEILLQLVGEHAAITPFSSFLVQRNAGNPRNDVARLQGARLVKAAESGKEGLLDETTIKEITGGDTISARFLYQEFFEFKPTFKLWLATNHRPSIRGTDDAIWRRIRLIPFTRQFSGRNRDPKLLETLQGELSGILAWAVKGCLEWQQVGLGPPPVVETATLKYRQESDILGRFMKERCLDGPKEQAAGNELFQAYVDFCAANGEKPESNNTFAKALSDRGIKKRRVSKGNVYQGIGLVPQATRAKLAEGE